MSDNEEADKVMPKTIEATNIYKISIKYAPFNRDDPEIWFTQLEAQFEIGGISNDATKYGHLIAALDPQTVKCVRDQILTPPKEKKYEVLKKVITERLCESAKIKLDRLLSGQQLGDKKPSQLLREMEALSINQVTEPVLKNLWMQRLPTHTQEILSCMEDSTLEKLAKAADKIIEVQKPASIYNLNAASRDGLREQPSNLVAQINALSQRVEELVGRFKKSNDTSYRARSQSPKADNTPRQRSNSRSNEQIAKHPNCWYHYKFETEIALNPASSTNSTKQQRKRKTIRHHAASGKCR